MTQRPGKLKQSCAAGLLCSGILLGALQLAAPWVQAATASENAKAATRALKQTGGPIPAWGSTRSEYIVCIHCQPGDSL